MTAKSTIDGDKTTSWSFASAGGFPEIIIVMPESLSLNGLSIFTNNEEWPTHYKVEGLRNDSSWEQLAELTNIPADQSTAVFDAPFQSSQFRITVFSAATTNDNSTSSASSESTASDGSATAVTSVNGDTGSAVSIANARAVSNTQINSNDQSSGTEQIQMTISEIIPVFSNNQASTTPSPSTSAPSSSTSAKSVSSTTSRASTSTHSVSASSTLSSSSSQPPSESPSPSLSPGPPSGARETSQKDTPMIIAAATSTSFVSLIIISAMAFRIRRRHLRGQPQMWTGRFRRVKPHGPAIVSIAELDNEALRKELVGSIPPKSELAGSEPYIAELDANPNVPPRGKTKKSDSSLWSIATRKIRRYTVM